MTTYQIIRVYMDESVPPKVIKTGLTLEEALEWCKDPETSSRTATSDKAREHTARYGLWFDGYGQEV